MKLEENLAKLLNYIEDLDPTKKEKLNLLLDLINKLDETSKNEYFKELFAASVSVITALEEKIKNNDCKINGHLFLDWEIDFLTFDEESSNKKIKYWKRTCAKCGVIDVSSIDPKLIEQQKNR